jgi:hypothetical protein
VIEGLLRDLAPQALGALVRLYGHFDTAEDATQEALIAAALQWPKEGIPDDPHAAGTGPVPNAQRGSPRAVPHLQRGLHQYVGAEPASQ